MWRDMDLPVFARLRFNALSVFNFWQIDYGLEGNKTVMLAEVLLAQVGLFHMSCTHVPQISSGGRGVKRTLDMGE